MNDSTKFFYSYTDFIEERNNFKIVDRTGLNRYDSPTTLYYKLIFYFTEDSGLLGLNGVFSDELKYYMSLKSDLIEKARSSGIIDPDEFNSIQNSIDIASASEGITNNIKNIKGAFNKVEKIVDCENEINNTKNARYKNITETLKNTAYNYLLLNAEYERAHLLDNFITLLSEINSSSPWYFQEITGLDTAIERKMFSEGEFKIEDKPKQITIKCLHDAYDDRIGTLLDLYRAACFSYTDKKEVVPANLRKFNMGVLVFNAPIRGKGGKSGIKENMILIPDENTDSNYYIPSAKLIELRNCEIDYNSSKSAWGTLNTSSDPFSPEYTITINFDDCYESRYNEIMGSVVTDFINADFNGIQNVKTINDNSALGNQNVEKGYWTNSDYESASKKLYSEKLDYDSNTKNVNIKLNTGTVFGGNVLTTQWNNLKDKTEFLQIPSLNKDDNIHDYGTVNMFGEFEYLNRLDGMEGELGGVVNQKIGGAISFIRKKAAQMYLGNIRSMSVSDALEMSEKTPDRGFTTKEIQDGGEIGRALNKGKVLNNIINNTNRSENESTETHFTTSNIHDNTSKIPVPRKMPKRQNDPNGNPIEDRFVTSEIWPDPISRNLNKGTILDEDVINNTLGNGDKLSSNSWDGEITERQFTTKEIWPDPIQRDLYKGELIDEDVVNSTLGNGNRIDGKMAWTGETTQAYLRNKELYKDPSQRNIEGTPSQVEIWKDPFQRNIDSDTIGELPGYIKNRTKFLNEMNTKQSIRNNI